MAAAFRTSAAGGSSSGTGNRTVTIVPAVGDLLIIYCFAAANTNDTPTCSDDNGSGSYDRIDVMNASISAVNYRLSVFVRTALMVNTTSTVITVATGSNTSGAVHAIAVSGLSRAGSSAVRSKGSQNNQAAGTAAPALNQNALTGNMTIVAHGSADTTTTAPTNWTERQDTNFANDTVALETATRDSGFTSTTITFGAASSTVFCSHALELDNSALFTRTALVDGVGAIASVQTFFSVFSKAVAVDGVGAVIVAGQRSLLRSAVVNATGDILTSATFLSIFARSALVDGTGSITSIPSFFSIFNQSVSLDASGAIATSGRHSVSRSSAVDGAATTSTAALFLSVSERAISLGGTVEIEASGISFSILAGIASLESAGGVQSNGFVLSSGLSILGRSISIQTIGLVETTGTFFSTFLNSSVLEAIGGFESNGQVQPVFAEFERASVLNTAGNITSAGIRELLRAGSIDIAAGINCSGSAGAGIFGRQILISSIASILSSGQGSKAFHPREEFNIEHESRSVIVDSGPRFIRVEEGQQVRFI